MALLLPQGPRQSANQNLDNSHVPVNAALDQKNSISIQPGPKAKPTLGFLTPSKVDGVAWPIRPFLFVSSLFFIYPLKVLACHPILRSSERRLPLHEVLNKVCVI